jgi:multidrug efflux pump subunit AcrA (membrane-fusion protein)
MATLIPERAIQTQQNLTTVLTVDASDTVQATKVTLGPPHGDGMRVVTSELSEDARVLVSGLTAVRSGAKVKPQPAKKSAQKVVEEGRSGGSERSPTTEESKKS